MPDRMSQKVATLTPRHRQIVRLISLGCSVPEIAAILGLAEATVDNHRTAAMGRLGVEKATALTRIAIKHRISPLTDSLTATEKRKARRAK